MTSYFGKEIDEEKLRILYTTDPLLRTLFDFLETQPRDERAITVHKLLERMGAAKISVKRADVIRMLQTLQGEDRGWFWIGRRGHESRFDFYAPMRAMARVASGKGIPPKRAPNLIQHKFRLRADLEITMELPSDLSDKEVNRIADFLKTLPFDHAELRAAA